jgi:tetratricopeptide (TPR) repeat protein
LLLARAVGDRAREAKTLYNIGIVYHDLGDKARALEYFEQALLLWRAVGDRAWEAVTLFNIAVLQDAQGNMSEAIALLERVVELDETVKSPRLASDRAALEHLRAWFRTSR